MGQPLTLDLIQQAVSLPDFDGERAQFKMMPRPRPTRRPPQLDGHARLGGVLLLLYGKDGNMHLVLTRRREDLKNHAGQISFPGGRHEPPESLKATALRETHEEIGIAPMQIRVLGELAPFYILPSDFQVHPFVGWYDGAKRPSFTPDRREVAEILEVSLALLLEPAVRCEEPRTIRGYELMIPYFDVAGHKVWGATAMMLSEFLERVQTVIGNQSSVDGDQ